MRRSSQRQLLQRRTIWQSLCTCRCRRSPPRRRRGACSPVFTQRLRRSLLAVNTVVMVINMIFMSVSMTQGDGADAEAEASQNTSDADMDSGAMLALLFVTAAVHILMVVCYITHSVRGQGCRPWLECLKPSYVSLGQQGHHHHGEKSTTIQRWQLRCMAVSTLLMAVMCACGTVTVLHSTLGVHFEPEVLDWADAAMAFAMGAALVVHLIWLALESVIAGVCVCTQPSSRSRLSSSVTDTGAAAAGVAVVELPQIARAANLDDLTPVVAAGGSGDSGDNGDSGSSGDGAVPSGDDVAVAPGGAQVYV